ncbi:hypothetical protein TNCV_4716331 [Trichonephila clavipes]|nr:hypothetical protein TNCV_4716331 [Trichonephila clavipes]
MLRMHQRGRVCEEVNDLMTDECLGFLFLPVATGGGWSTNVDQECLTVPRLFDMDLLPVTSLILHCLNMFVFWIKLPDLDFENHLAFGMSIALQ